MSTPGKLIWITLGIPCLDSAKYFFFFFFKNLYNAYNLMFLFYFSCAAPMRLSGEYITNITINFCPMLDKTFSPRKTFSLSDLRPKHVLWTILAVAMVAAFGMILGLLVNAIKKVYKTRFQSQPIHYININSDSSFA